MVSYILVASLDADGKFTLEPGYQTDEEPTQDEFLDEDPRNRLTVEVLDRASSSLAQIELPLVPICALPNTPGERVVMGRVPFPPETTAIRFRYLDKVIHELRVPNARPTAAIDWTPGKVVKGIQTVSWRATHDEGVDLRSMVFYSHTDGTTWQPLSLSSSETKLEVDFDKLPGGLGIIRVVVSDGMNTESIQTPPFKVAEKSCVAMILSPIDGAKFEVGDDVLFRGQGFHLEEDTAELEALSWDSSVDGKLGDGPFLEIPDLSVGSHTISLTAGVGDRAGQAVVSIAIGAAKG